MAGRKRAFLLAYFRHEHAYLRRSKASLRQEAARHGHLRRLLGVGTGARPGDLRALRERRECPGRCPPEPPGTPGTPGPLSPGDPLGAGSDLVGPQAAQAAPQASPGSACGSRRPSRCRSPQGVVGALAAQSLRGSVPTRRFCVARRGRRTGAHSLGRCACKILWIFAACCSA